MPSKQADTAAEKPAKRPPKTVKERKFVKAYVQNGGNATQAALAAYDTTPATARQIGSELLTKLDVSAIMENMGLDDEVLISCLVMGLLES